MWKGKWGEFEKTWVRGNHYQNIFPTFEKVIKVSLKYVLVSGNNK